MLTSELLKQYPEIDPADLTFLLCELWNVSRAELPLKIDCKPEDIFTLESWLKRLASGEPPQYIVNKCSFYGLELYVDSRVLIPRFDTEPMVEALLGYLAEGDSVLDIGVGSGAIALALKSRKPSLKITATDISSDALAVAHKNSRALKLDIELVAADLYPAVSARFDAIVSNPPYISREDYSLLASRVKDFEPREALLAENNGFEYFERIINSANRYLKPGGILAFEHGHESQSALRNLTESAGFKTLQNGKDLAGKDRFLITKNIDKVEATQGRVQ